MVRRPPFFIPTDHAMNINTNMGFKAFFEALHSFSMGKLKHPVTGEAHDMSSERNAYDSGFERANSHKVVGHENVGKFPLLTDINNDTTMVVGYTGEGKYPVWLKSTNEIFMADKNKNTYLVTTKDEKLVQQFIDFQRIYQVRENDPAAAILIANATILRA
jgi:hypothetical protein